MKMVWVAVVLEVLALPAGADREATRRAEAKRLKDMAAVALERGDFQVALEELQAAYRMYPSANLRFNLGVAYAKLGKTQEAINEFEAFLKEAKDAPPTFRSAAEQQLQELKRGQTSAQATAAPAPSTPTTPSETVQSAPASQGHGRFFRLLPWITGGAAIGALVIGVGLFAGAASMNGCIATTCSGSRDAGMALEYTAYALWTISGVLAAGDVALWIIRAKRGSDHSAWIVPSGNGVMAGGTF